MDDRKDIKWWYTRLQCHNRHSLKEMDHDMLKEYLYAIAVPQLLQALADCDKRNLQMSMFLAYIKITFFGSRDARVQRAKMHVVTSAL